MKKDSDVIHNLKFWKPKIKEDVLLFSGHFNKFEFDKHIHDEYTITLIHDSNMKAFLKGSSYSFNKSTILTINPDEVHACKTDDVNGYKYNSIYFKPELLEKVFGKQGKNMYFSKNTLSNLDLYKKFQYLIYLDENRKISKLDFECMFIEYLKSIMSLNTNNSTFNNTLSYSDKLIQSAKEFINDNYFADLTLDDIANELKISKYHFLRSFKSKAYVSPHNYLMLRRIEKSKQFLQEGKAIVDIAHQCGFTDQSHFSKRFKNNTGLTPGSYQKFFN